VNVGGATPVLEPGATNFLPVAGSDSDKPGEAVGSLSRVRRPYAILVAVCTGWGTIPLIVRNVDLPASAIVAARLWVATAGLGAALLVRRRRNPGPALFSVRPVLCVAAAVVLAVHWLALVAAYKRAPAGTVILVVYLAPVAIAALAPWVLGESVSGRTIGALVVAATGFVLVAWPAVGTASGAGLLLAVLAAALFVALVLVSKPLAELYGGLRLAFMEMAGAGLVLVPVVGAVHWGRPEPAWGWLVVLGLVHTAIGTSLYLGALGRVPATHVAILGYLEPTSVVVWGWLFLSQRPAAGTVVGGLLILSAGMLVVRSPRVAGTGPLEEVQPGVAR
jgi:drug/metabolite transporter (DMT)-like permease